ncbi:MAG: hypothetical protein PVJ68_08725, partial [Candidatus Thiodiazotropha sp.]
MLVSTILVVSLILQCLAVYFVLCLIKITGKSLAWSLLALVIILMALDRGVSFGRMFLLDTAYQPDLTVELIGLAISALMAFGIRRITPIIAGLHSSAERQSEDLIRYRTIFENSPISIWEEDFSEIKEIFDQLRGEGITDIEIYLEAHPEVVRQYAK